MTDSLIELTEQVIAFRDERDWGQFHNLKDNALSIVIESGELAELVRWRESADVSKDAVSDELADILYWVLLTAHDAGISLPDALRKKLASNAEKYPIDKAKGNAIKYTQL